MPARGTHGKGFGVKGPPARHEEPKEQLPAAEGVILNAGELVAGDRVVYPNQGVCQVTGVETKEIAGQKLEFVRMEREEDGAAVLVPMGKVPTIGLRKVASGEQMEGVFHYLAAQYDDPELDWKVRHRDNADRLIAGGVLGVAEVVKGLHALSRIRPLPAKEREQYDNARHLLVHEVAVSLAVPPALAEDYIDYALMPPAGVTFKLKPPPKPVALPSRPRRRVTRTDDEDLGLDELGLDLELPETPGASPEASEAAEPIEAEEGLPAIPTPEEVPVPEGLVEADLPEEPAEEPAIEAVEEPAEIEDEGGPARKKVAPPKKPVPPAKRKPAKKPEKPTARKVSHPPARPSRVRGARAEVKASAKKPTAKKSAAKGGKRK